MRFYPNSTEHLYLYIFFKLRNHIENVLNLKITIKCFKSFTSLIFFSFSVGWGGGLKLKNVFFTSALSWKLYQPTFRWTVCVYFNLKNYMKNVLKLKNKMFFFIVGWGGAWNLEFVFYVWPQMTRRRRRRASRRTPTSLTSPAQATVVRCT